MPEEVYAVVSKISIHAPTRGATGHMIVLKCKTMISIHAPTRGATPMKCAKEISRIFQSTLLQEERRGLSVEEVKDYLISIHAPTRGATF